MGLLKPMSSELLSEHPDIKLSAGSKKSGMPREKTF